MVKVAKLILEKCDRAVFSKNNGRAELQKVNSIHNGTALNVNVEQYSSNDLFIQINKNIYFIKYAPITSVDV